MTRVYKALSDAEWREAQRDGVFRGAAIDVSDGFIHLSDAAQVETTVALYFADRDDLVLLALDAEAFGDALKWEPSRGGALFPHLYAELPVARVLAANGFSSRRPAELAALIA